MQHKEDDDVYEAGGEMPDRGRLIDPSEIPGPAPVADPFHEKWKTLGQWGAEWLTEAPPRRHWLLERDDDATGGRTRQGVLPRGKVGMLVAAGGIGKTMALVQLALAVATGRKWLDAFYTPSRCGRVLLALAEEDAEEIRRRAYNAARAMRLTDEQCQAALANIVALPLSGSSVALTESDGSNTVESSVLHALRKRLEGNEWTLIVLDPLSRFAGCDAEKDNASATRFIEAAESLTKVAGGPSVLIAHHNNKASRSGETEASASDSRGVGALTDGARWAASLTRQGDDLATFAVVKSNYGTWGAPVTLVRDAAYSGALRVETPVEAATRRQREELAEEAKRLQKRRALGKAPAALPARVVDTTAEVSDDELVKSGAVY